MEPDGGRLRHARRLIGLLVGLSQVFLLEAWIKVEAGFRPGRDLILSRDRTLIGRAEGSDIALFGDNGVEMQHALIVLDKGGYYLEPLPNTPGTYVNDQPIMVRTPLRGRPDSRRQEPAAVQPEKKNMTLFSCLR